MTANGIPKPAPASRAKTARRRAPARQANSAAPAVTPELAGFRPFEPSVQDEPRWPVHPFSWLQPELGVYVPASSGAHIKRLHKTPAPGFLPVEVYPSRPEVPAADAPDPRRPHVAARISSSDLAPLGWDARVLLRPGPKGPPSPEGAAG